MTQCSLTKWVMASLVETSRISSEDQSSDASHSPEITETRATVLSDVILLEILSRETSHAIPIEIQIQDQV